MAARSLPSLVAVLSLLAGACGDKGDGGSSTSSTSNGGTTDNCGFAPCDTSVSDSNGSSGTASGTSAGTAGGTGSTGASGSTGGAGVPCPTHRDEASCAAGDPGNGQVCGWVPAWPTTYDVANDACGFEEPSYYCVQQLGDTGGTPFGSCGGDGTPPVYWRDGADGIELLGSDGFFTPDGWSPCDCHDGTADPGDPVECCCPCSGGWPPG